jgi:Fic family protein
MAGVQDSIREMRQVLDALRPLPAGTVAALDRWYDVELTYTSNALEGNTLTRSETAIVLEKGITVSGKPLKDHLEATGHSEALGYMRELAKGGEPVREGDIRNLHRLVLSQVAPAEAGKYSDHQRTISGTELVLRSPAEIPALMGDFGAWLARATPGPEAAFDAHEKLVTIHPFSDGNGRTARLLMNLLLIKAGYPPVVIPPEERSAYHDALHAVQVDGDGDRYHEFLWERLAESLRYTLAVLHAPGYGA